MGLSRIGEPHTEQCFFFPVNAPHIPIVASLRCTHADENVRMLHPLDVRHAITLASVGKSVSTQVGYAWCLDTDDRPE